MKQFNQWFSRWNRQLQAVNRRVLLFIDNCAAHNLTAEQSNINIKFLPPNTTSVLQPMDQGVIRSFKTHYRRHLVNRLLAAVDRNDNNFKVDILQAINILSIAWREVTPITVANCFRKAGFVKEDNPVDDGDQEINPEDIFWDAVQEEFAIDVPFENYVAVDDDVLTSETMTESDIVDAVKKSNDAADIKPEEPENDEGEEEEIQRYVPENTAQCLEYISGIHTFFQSSKVPEHVLEALKTLEDHALKSSVMRRKKQCKITDMFTKD